jgi:hypothetical protein
MTDAYLKGWLQKANSDIKVIQNEFSLPEEKLLQMQFVFMLSRRLRNF